MEMVKLKPGVEHTSRRVGESSVGVRKGKEPVPLPCPGVFFPFP